MKSLRGTAKFSLAIFIDCLRDLSPELLRDALYFH